MSDALVEKLLKAWRFLYRRGITDAFGQLSVRLPGDDRFLLTRHALGMNATADDLPVFDLDGRQLEGAGEPPVEYPIRLEIIHHERARAETHKPARHDLSRPHSAVMRLAPALAVCVALAAPFAAHAQSYPTKPIRLILPFAGGTELIGRMVGSKLAPVLGQQVVADPRFGASGNIGWEAAAKAPADGYTLVMGAVPLLTNPHLNPKVGYDPLKSFAPIALVATIPNIVVVHPSVPARTLRELVQLARTSPGKIAYGSGGVGSANHLAAEFLQASSRIRLTHVPYKSATFALTGAMSGDVDLVIVVVSSAVSLVKAGKMRALAILDERRNASAPEVPTSSEAGFGGLVAVNWYALLAPAGVPGAVVQRLNTEAVKAMNTAETRASLAAMGGEPASLGPSETAEFLRAEYARWGKVIREANIKAE